MPPTWSQSKLLRADYAPMLAWVREREAIRIRKDACSPFPWTDDPILHTYRFCNVRREDDRVTVWVRKNIRETYADHPYLWFMLCAARQINWPDTLGSLIAHHYRGAWPDDEEFSPERLGIALAQRAIYGDKVFTGAYLIPPAKGEWKTKGQGVAEVTLGNLWHNREKLAQAFKSNSKLSTAHRALVRYEGWGNFLAYQAVVDMRFCPSLLESASDVSTWAAAGPGTIRGLNRLYGRRTDAPLSQEQALDEMLAIYEVVEKETGVAVDLSDVPNILCETDKYLRVRNGEGKPRALYVPGRGS